MTNPLSGSVIAPGIGELRYTHKAVAKIIDEFGDDWPDKFSEAQLKSDVRVLDKFAAFGSSMTYEEIFEASPPIRPMCEAITSGLNVAFNGPEEGEAAQEASENPLKQTGGLSFLKRLKLLFGWNSPPVSFGA